MCDGMQKVYATVYDCPMFLSGHRIPLLPRELRIILYTLCGSRVFPLRYVLLCHPSVQSDTDSLHTQRVAGLAPCFALKDAIP